MRYKIDIKEPLILGAFSNEFRVLPDAELTIR